MTPRAAKTQDQSRRAAIVDASAMAFALAGYQRTQMADIAAGAGVALGTLYRYAESKEELFAAALARGAGQDASVIAGAGSIRDVEDFFASNLTWLGWVGERIDTALYAGGEPAPFRHMLATIYDGIAGRRLALRILDRSAHDLPRLSEVYVRQVREPVLRSVVNYLNAMQSSGRIAPVAHAEASARLILETCAWFAMHRLFSPGGAAISDADARSTTLAHLAASFAALD
ncbi:MAG: helix-turn-helix domain-containing protein [Hyphomonadaceae bacterium]